jgi:hypothetical protein
MNNRFMDSQVSMIGGWFRGQLDPESLHHGQGRAQCWVAFGTE